MNRVLCQRLASIFIVLAGISSQQQATAAGITFVPSIAYEHKRLTFDQEQTGLNPPSGSGLPDYNNAEYEVEIPTINMSLTMAVEKMYFTLKYATAIKEVSTDTEETQRVPFGVNYLTINDSEIKVDREDMSFTAGYNIWKRMNLFVGYMEGETTITPDPYCTDFPACSRINAAGFNVFQDADEYQQIYKEEGPFIGLSYAWQIAEVGTLSASAAYADMSGSFEDNFFDGEFDYEGDATGTSLGLTWTQPMGEWSSYFIDLRRQAYSMSGVDKSGGSDVVASKVETDETMVGLTAGVQFYF